MYKQSLIYPHISYIYLQLLLAMYVKKLPFDNSTHSGEKKKKKKGLSKSHYRHKYDHYLRAWIMHHLCILLAELAWHIPYSSKHLF